MAPSNEMLAEDGNRVPVHLRDIKFRSFLRQDDRWDIEGTLWDTKAYDQVAVERGPLPAGTPVHHMRVRLTVDDAFKIHSAEVEMPAAPFGECQQAREPLQRLVGATMGAGWRKTVSDAMGGERGCTHLRELLSGLATAAFQTIGRYRAHQRQLAGLPEPVLLKPRSPLGQCLGWAFDGGPMQRYRPEFFGWRPSVEEAAPSGD